MPVRMVIAAAATVGIAIPAMAAKLVKNGSFETPVVPDGSYQLFNTGDSFTGWEVVGDSDNVAIVSGDFSYCAPLPATQFTAQNTTTTIAFINGDPSGDATNGLDAVSVKLVSAR